MSKSDLAFIAIVCMLIAFGIIGGIAFISLIIVIFGAHDYTLMREDDGQRWHVVRAKRVDVHPTPKRS